MHINIFKKRKKYLPFVLFLSLSIVVFCFILAFYPSYFYLGAATSQQFSELANSFLHNKLYFLEGSSFDAYRSDNTLFKGYFYWPLGPFSSVILMPFVYLGNLFNFYFYQGYLNFFLVIFIAYFIFAIARKIKYSMMDSAYWVVAFIFSSMFFCMAIKTPSWYFGHTVAVFLLFFALFEYFNKKRYLLIGLFFGLALLTRFTAVIGITFFIFEIIFLEKNNWKIKFQNLIKLGIIPFVCFCLLFAYNQARFENIFDQGYRGQILYGGMMRDKENYGLFNLNYLPRGIYYSLLGMPLPVIGSETNLLIPPFFRPDPWGMSIFYTSPYLLYIFFMKLKNKKAKYMIISSVIVAACILPSFFIGYLQFGFRYALDFMPFLFTAFMLMYKDQKDRMGMALKIIIIISALINFYLLRQML